MYRKAKERERRTGDDRKDGAREEKDRKKTCGCLEYFLRAAMSFAGRGGKLPLLGGDTELWVDALT